MNVAVVSNGHRSLLEALRHDHHLDGPAVQYVTCDPRSGATDDTVFWPEDRPLYEVLVPKPDRWVALFHCQRCLSAEEIRAFPAVVRIFSGPIEFLRQGLTELGVQSALLRYLELTHQDPGYTCITVLHLVPTGSNEVSPIPIQEIWIPVFPSVVDPEELLGELWSREVLELVHIRCGRMRLDPLPDSRSRQGDFTRTHELEVALRFGKEYALQEQSN